MSLKGRFYNWDRRTTISIMEIGEERFTFFTPDADKRYLGPPTEKEAWRLRNWRIRLKYGA